MTTEERGLTTVERDTLDLAPRMVMSIAEAQERLHQFQGFVKAVMVEGVDFGKIPGVEKPTLLKPGAEKLAEIYGLSIEVDVAERIENWEGGFFHYEVRCHLRSKRTGQIMATGIGSCNTKEKRYSDRWAFERDIPDGVEKATLKRRTGTSKAGKPYTEYLVPNADVFTLVNTVLKMAKKRAMIDAVLSATRSSGIFTQDVEDWVESEIVRHEPTPVVETATMAGESDIVQAPLPSQSLTCANPDCGKIIEGITLKDGTKLTNEEFTARSGGLCLKCVQERKRAAARA